jgi:DNA mismatch repair protein MutL
MTFVNGRIIRSPVLSLPLREACDGVLAKGLHPPAVLFFEVDPIAVDCNVHPAKREVRFRDPSLLRSAALLAARSAWGALPGKPELLTDDLPDPLFPPLPNIPKNAVPPGSPPENPLGSASYQREFQAEQDAGRVRESREGMAGGYGRASSIRYLGILAGIYLLFEEGGALLLLEIRAARERILYERLFGQLGNGSIESKRLLNPEVLELPPADILWIEAHASLLHASGLSAEPFGAGSLKVDAVPSDTASLPVSDVVSGLLDDLRSLGDSPSPGLPEREALAASVSRLSARAGSLPGGEDSAVLLFRDLLSCSLPYVTPGGRPTMVQFSPGELQRRFKA